MRFGRLQKGEHFGIVLGFGLVERYTTIMVIRLLLIAQLLSYQALTMPCRACPMATTGSGECTASGCCSSKETETKSGCCGSGEDTEVVASCCATEEPAGGRCCGAMESASCCDETDVEAVVTADEPKVGAESCQCCPISTPCDRCLALVTDRPSQVRPLVEDFSAPAIVHAAFDSQIMVAMAACLHPPDPGHKSSLQSLQCSWLN